jgi:hypothetical protein
MSRAAGVALGFFAVVWLSVGSGTSAFSAVSYPPVPRPVVDRLPTCLDPMTQATLPSADLASDIASIEKMAGKSLQGIGPCGASRITLALVPGSERLAARVRTRFGAAVLITVGLTVWNGHTGRSPRCMSLPETTSMPKDLNISLHLRSNNVKAGGAFSGTLTLRYEGPSSFEMDTGQPVEAVVVRRGTHRVVGVSSGGIAGTGYGLRLGPGQSYQVSVIGGTARCDGGIGSALPAGHYQAMAVAMDENGQAPRYLTNPVPLTVAPK